jgi:hypothetical protein
VNEGGWSAGEVEKEEKRKRFGGSLTAKFRACWDEKKWVVLWEKRGCGKCSDVLVG